MDLSFLDFVVRDRLGHCLVLALHVWTGEDEAPDVAGRAPWPSKELDAVDPSKRVAFEPRYFEAPRESVDQLPKTSGCRSCPTGRRIARAGTSSWTRTR